MKREFQRYDLSQFRKLVGVLELLGASGLVLGYWLSRPLLGLSALGLSGLMVVAVIARVKAKDPWLEVGPAFALMLVNVYLCYKSFYL